MVASAALTVAALLAARPADPPKFEIKDGDRIVWIGNTLVEREQRYGYWETALHAAFPDKSFTLRNLGWSGDTVFGDARAGFDTPAKGFERLVSLTLELKPTVIFVSYGTNESFEGEAGLPKFEKGLEKLLDALKPANARIVLFTPLTMVGIDQITAAKQRAAQAKPYSETIRTVAGKRGLMLADAERSIAPPLMMREMSRYDSPNTGFGKPEVSVNGMHLTEVGYEFSAGGFLRCLGLTPPALDAQKLEPLRKAVVEKNQLFFYRWRPQNETYLFGFRKHEQGKNAAEVAEFDPLVAKAEAEIDALRKTLK